MPVEFAALIPAFFFSLSGIMTRRGMEGSNPQTGSLVVVEVNFVVFTASLLAVDFSGLGFSWYWLSFLAAGAVSPALSLLLMFRSIDKIGVAPTSSLANVNAFFGAAWAFVILGERPAPIIWAGIALVVAGMYFISGGGAGRVKPRDMLLPLSSAACFGLAHTLRKLGFLGYEPLLFEAFLQGLAAAVASPILFRLGGTARPLALNRRSLGFFLLAGLSQAAAQLGVLYALRRGMVAVISPIVSTAPLFTILLTPLLLRGREKITIRLLLSALLIVAGVVLVTSRR
ncbi:MAG: DMT family transporter [Candidatus Tectomicrobia bacterium]|uniref:DMT family transporter n=1 Tax=Tectimicrobiota bacterium TaxID=2528274 RepID=A0A932MQJ7_UNCTE|nr:DMT family transporter [Candidatus Tectomicrobia bacterium]